jgi:Ser-tRNA(Ala) deacylase AlaX
MFQGAKADLQIAVSAVSISLALLPLMQRLRSFAGMEIITGFDDEPNERRYWEIRGFSRVPCGGTHVKRTGEIGPIKLKRNNKGRGNERVEIYLAK